MPHFEKMLYDNALLAVAYLEGYQLTRREEFARVAREVLDYVAREMTGPHGAFYSATDADSPAPGGHDQEGWFFTWTRPELEAVLGEERARRVAAYYGVSAGGNFEGRTILSTPAPSETVAASLRVKPAELREEIAAARRALYAARARRPPPHLDDKVIASWNGLMISAFARGARVLAEPRYAEAAARAADFILAKMRDGARLHRTFKDGRARHAGTIEDHAFVAAGLLDLYEAAHDPRRLEEAIALQEVLEQHFWDEAGGGFFLTPHDGDRLLAREKPDYDGAEPSGNSVAALNMLRLEEFTGERRYRQKAERTLAAFAARMAGAMPKMVAALDYYLDEPVEVVLVAPAGGSAAALEDALRPVFLPNRIFVSASEGEDLERQAAVVPLVADKRALRGQPTAFVCRARYCDLPTSDPAVFTAQLGKARPLFPNASPAPLPVTEPR